MKDDAKNLRRLLKVAAGLLSRGIWGRPPYPILNEIRAAAGMPALKVPGEAKSAAVFAWLVSAGTEKTTAQIARNTKISEHTVRQSLAYLEERGQVEATVKPQWTHGGIWRASTHQHVIG